MRVIAGESKGRPLKPVSGQATRPTTDKVKETIFNKIGPYFDGGIGLDLYSGSGGLGIEALSRGLDKVVFVDRAQKSIATTKANIKNCNFESRSEIFRNDAHRALKALHKRDIYFSLIFLDPPYEKQKLAKDLKMIETFGLLTRNGTVIVEHSANISLPKKTGNVTLDGMDVYGGNIAVSMFRNHT